jgi:hypothetical protein
LEHTASDGGFIFSILLKIEGDLFMQAIAFETEIRNDVIHIPKEYYGKIPYKATITIVYSDIQNDETELLKKRTAYERLQKYRGIIDKDIDYKQELKSALDEKYGSAN